MTSKKGIPRGWTWENGTGTGHLRHDGQAMNSCRWLKNAIWNVTTNEQQQTAIIHCYWSYYINNEGKYSHATATLTIARNNRLTVEKGPWEILPRPGETPLSAGIRWVRQQENAAKKYGSR